MVKQNQSLGFWMCESMGDIMMTASIFIYSQLSRRHRKKLTCGEIWFNLLILAIQTVHLIVNEAVCMQTHPGLTAKTIASATWHTRRTQCERGDFEAAQSLFVSVCLIYVRSTSRHFGPHSRQRRHKSGWGTHTWCSHTWNHILHLEHQRGPRFKEKGKTQYHHISPVSSFQFNIWQIHLKCFEILFVTASRSRH